jgi:spermidine/putrescine transport system permease protein
MERQGRVHRRRVAELKADSPYPPPALKKRNWGLIYAGPITLWFSVFFVVPLVFIILFSFLKANIDGGVLPVFSLKAYRILTTPRFLRVLWNTVWVSGLSTLITIVAAMPCAYFMARSRHKNFLLILVIIPFWTNFIIRVFAWKTILEPNGVINSLLKWTGFIAEPLSLEHTWASIILINVYTYLTYAIMPLYSAIEKFDFSLLEAARDLGASKPQSMFRVLVPNVKGGITTAVFFVLIPLLGSFAVPQLIGTKDMYLLGNEINDNVYKYFDWPSAYAIAVFLMLITNLAVMLFYSSGKKPPKAKIGSEAKIEEPNDISILRKAAAFIAKSQKNGGDR